MARGTVITYNPRKRYGSIKPDQEDTPLFVHRCAITTSDDPPLKPGQVVYYEVLNSNHGRQAVQVRPVQQKPASSAPANSMP
jgi:cold shock CspA family protein